MSSFENTLQTATVSYLRRRGHYAVNIHGNEYQSGVPDVLACVCGRFVGLELKSSVGRVKPLQRANLRLITQAGGIGIHVRSMEMVRSLVATLEEQESAITLGQAVRLRTSAPHEVIEFLVDAQDVARVAEFDLVPFCEDSCIEIFAKPKNRPDAPQLPLPRYLLRLEDEPLIKLDYFNGDGLDCRRRNIKVAVYNGG